VDWIDLVVSDVVYEKNDVGSNYARHHRRAKTPEYIAGH